MRLPPHLPTHPQPSPIAAVLDQVPATTHELSELAGVSYWVAAHELAVLAGGGGARGFRRDGITWWVAQ